MVLVRSFAYSLVGLVLILSAAVAARADQPSQIILAAASEANAAPAPVATTAPATQPAAEEAAASWPPGLIMQGLKACHASDGLDALGLRIWGFVETGFVGRLTTGQNPLPGRAFDARRPDTLRLNQLRITLDRPYDATKNFDIGGRADILYGGDAKITHSYGLLDKAGEDNGDEWIDMTQAYGQIWLKTGKDSGLESTIGKMITTFGAEVIDATGNALYSHSYLFNFAIPFTHTAVMEKYIINSQWSAYFCITNGWDDFEDNNHSHSYMAGGAWSSEAQIGGHSATTVNLNFITGPEQSDNNHDYRTCIDLVATHWWTEKLSQTLNADFATDSVSGGVGQANWGGIAHYLTYTFNDYLSGTWRTEWFRDDGGTRTGVDASWYENTWGVGITPCPNDAILKNLLLRPELRWDFADEPAFGGDNHNMLTLAFDVIFKF